MALHALDLFIPWVNNIVWQKPPYYERFTSTPSSPWKPGSKTSWLVFPLKLWLGPGKQTVRPGDITSCVFKGPVVSVIWFRWKLSVYITTGFGFPVLSIHHFSTQSSAYSDELQLVLSHLDVFLHSSPNSGKQKMKSDVCFFFSTFLNIF